jgi:coenzyme F420-reducing hydrogenase delta subunit
VEQAQKILEGIGIGGERVQMYNLSSSEAPRFVEVAIEMTEKIKEMGPNPMKLAQKKKAA